MRGWKAKAFEKTDIPIQLASRRDGVLRKNSLRPTIFLSSAMDLQSE
jgi:hypothetical protein